MRRFMFLMITRGNRTKLEPVAELLEEKGHHCYRFSDADSLDMSDFDEITPIRLTSRAGSFVAETASTIEWYQPHALIVVGDRWETLGAVYAATMMHVPIVHFEGGEISGGIDEPMRHAITMLSHLHLTATEDARTIVLELGQDVDTVFNVGATSLDSLAKYADNKEVLPRKPYLLVIWHSWHGEDFQETSNELERAVEAVQKSAKMDVVWVGSNLETGSPGTTFQARGYPFEEFAGLLANAACVVGNSSAGVREAAYFGVPVVNVGDRQQGRYKPRNVANVFHIEEDEIYEAIKEQLLRINYEPDYTFGKGNAAEKAAKIIEEFEFKFQKRITV